MVKTFHKPSILSNEQPKTIIQSIDQRKFVTCERDGITINPSERDGIYTREEHMRLGKLGKNLLV
jgi:hypothetical protein